jgi:PAS domain S-box-containing protein
MAADDRTAGGQHDSPAAATTGSGPGSFPALIGLARRSVVLAGLIGVASLVATGFALMQLRDYHVQTAVRTLQHVAYGLSEVTSRQIVEADRNILRILEAARLQPELLADREQRDRVIPRNLSSIGQASAIAFIDAQGDRHVYTQAGTPAAVSFPDTSREGLIIVSGSDKEPPGLFLRRTVWLRGNQAGALIMRLSDRHLADMYNVWRGQSGNTVSLTTTDHRPLFQHPDAPELSAKPSASDTIDPRPFADTAGTRYRSPADGRDYLVVSRRTPGYPLVVHAAVSEREALAEWTAQGSILVVAMVTLVLIGMTMARRHAGELSRRAAAVGQMQALQGALSIEEAKLQAMFRTALESIIVIDEHGIVERINPAAERTFGYSADELVGRNVSILMPSPDRERHDGYLQRYLRTGTPRIIGTSGRELVARRKDGSEFPIKLGVAEQRLGGVRRFTGTVRDITHEKLSEALLRAETRIATVLSSAGTVEHVASEVVAALCGLGFVYGHWAVRDAVTREWNIRGQSMAPGIDPSAVEALTTGVSGPGPDSGAARAMQTGDVVWRTHLETQTASPRAAAACGAGFYAYVAVPVRSAGEVVAVIELFCARNDPRNDILEGALRNIGLQVGQLLSRLQVEEQLQKIVRTVPSAVFQARVGERRTIALTFMSAQVEQLWGVSAKAVLAKPRQVLWKIPPAYRRDLLRALSRAVIKASGWDVTVPIMKEDGLRWLRVHAAPGFKRGETPVWDGIISDVTDQKVAEQQVVRLNLDLERRVEERTQQLAAVNKELEAFSDSVSHDLRAPLRGIRSYSEMLKQSGLVTTPEAQMMVERIISQGVQMEQLIQALLELSQISRHELRRKDTDISAIARAVLDDLQARDPERKVQWQVQSGLRAYADPRLMRAVFENLLANAWKFTRNREEATIEVGVKPDAADTFFVRDNGAGFDAAYADKLFQPFQRLHPASQFEGTGIGLATVQRIIRRHGGRIWAESKPSEGATFYFEVSTESDANYTARA